MFRCFLHSFDRPIRSELVVVVNLLRGMLPRRVSLFVCSTECYLVESLWFCSTECYLVESLWELRVDPGALWCTPSITNAIGTSSLICSTESPRRVSWNSRCSLQSIVCRLVLVYLFAPRNAASQSLLSFVRLRSINVIGILLLICSTECFPSQSLFGSSR